MKWVVIEFNNVKSLQYGTTSTDTINITAVNQNKAMVYFTGYTASTTVMNYNDLISDYIWASSTQLQFQHGSTFTSIHYYIVEFL